MEEGLESTNTIWLHLEFLTQTLKTDFTLKLNFNEVIRKKDNLQLLKKSKVLKFAFVLPPHVPLNSE